MTKEELINPRYKVIADYPSMGCIVGHIIQLTDIYPTTFTVPMEAGGEKWKQVVYHNTMPHIFKRLEWWEDRNEEDLPDYVKFQTTGDIFNVTYEDYKRGKIYVRELSGEYISDYWYLAHTTPSTREEYEAQQSS